ncbi:unnamed protein product, partial [Mesorhabditis spiculigera]
MYKKRPLRKRIGADFIDFAEHTSAHGLPRAYVSSGCRRALWLVLFFVCFSVFAYQATLIVVKFRRNDIIVNVEIKYKDIDFPSVTVCNLNPYKTSKALEFGGVKDTNRLIKQCELSSSSRRGSFELCQRPGAKDQPLPLHR